MGAVKYRNGAKVVTAVIFYMDFVVLSLKNSVQDGSKFLIFQIFSG